MKTKLTQKQLSVLNEVRSMMDKLKNNPYGRIPGKNDSESYGFGRFNPGNGRPNLDDPSLPHIKNRPTNEKVDEKLIADISESVMRALNEMNHNGIDDIIETAYNDCQLPTNEFVGLPMG